MPERPDISVIVFAREAVGSIRDALRSLESQAGIERAEVLVVDGSTDGTAEIVAEEFPWVRHIRLSPGSMPELKGRAIQEARGEAVAILDVVDRADPGWLVAIRRGLEDPRAEAIGGEVVLEGPPHGINAAGYLFEYGAFAPPLAAGPTDGDLPGNNLAYRRRVFAETCADLLPDGFWKPFFHRRIRERGGVLHLHPSMRVRHHIRLGAVAFLVRRFHYGRCFGAMRFARASTRERWLYLAFEPVVPLLLCWRHVRRAWKHAGNRRLLGPALPALLLLCFAWGVGEWIGTWFGSGSSCRKVY